MREKPARDQGNPDWAGFAPPTPAEITAEYNELQRDAFGARAYHDAIAERDQARKERDEAVALLRVSNEYVRDLLGSYVSNPNAWALARGNSREASAFLTRLDAGKVTR